MCSELTQCFLRTFSIHGGLHLWIQNQRLPRAGCAFFSLARPLRAQPPASMALHRWEPAAAAIAAPVHDCCKGRVLGQGDNCWGVASPILEPGSCWPRDLPAFELAWAFPSSSLPQQTPAHASDKAKGPVLQGALLLSPGSRCTSWGQVLGHVHWTGPHLRAGTGPCWLPCPEYHCSSEHIVGAQ